LVLLNYAREFFEIIDEATMFEAARFVVGARRIEEGWTVAIR
jgi:hypothetical protein